MHDPTKDGNDYFLCDFCRRPWAEERPMVEGHKGSLVCSQCLTTAYAAVIHHDAGLPGGRQTCTMCLEHRDEPHWPSPLHEEAIICRRCIKQSATTLEKDPDSGWRRPAGPPK